jgi:hypothetical protein
MARNTAKMGGEFKSRRGMNEELRCRNSEPLRVRLKGIAITGFDLDSKGWQL